MELVALNDIRNFTLSSATPMGEIELIKFGGAKQVYISDYEVILVKFDFGIAQFESLPVPNAAIINEWIETAFTTKLLPNLKSIYPTSTFTLLENISYGLQYPQNPPLLFPNDTSTSNSSNNGTYFADDDSNIGENATGTSSNSSESSSRTNIPLIAGVAAGAAACMMFIILGLVTKQRRDTNRKGSTRELTHSTLDFNDQPPPSKKSKKQPRLHGTKSAETSPSSSKGGGNNNNKVDMTDVRSLADSESEWTVATEAGDSMALKNIAASLNSNNADGPGTTSKSASTNDRQINLILSESFERDRTVAITKDMLTGQWSGRVSNHRGGASHHQQQSESVLQPSHFTASHERRARKAQRAAAAATAATSGSNTAPMPDRETSSVSSKGDESSVDDSLVFEQAHEDTTSTWSQKKEQISPSNTSKRRTRDISPLQQSNDTRSIA